jgi:pimeloyl-ACP methyl ester carboxylesterase
MTARTTLVILPGMNSGAYLFAAAQAALGPRVKVLALDPPGVGRPPLLPLGLPFSAGGYARAVLRLLEERKLQKICVLGHSLGSFAAQELARLAPGRVEKLVLVSASSGQPGMTRDLGSFQAKVGKSFWEVNQLIERDAAEGMKVFFGKSFVDHNPRAYEAFIAARAENLAGAAATLAHMAAGGTFGSGRWVHKLNLPVLVIQGGADVLISPASARALAAAMPQARYLELHGVGHFPMLEHADFWRYVGEFLEGSVMGERPAAVRGAWDKVKEFFRLHG